MALRPDFGPEDVDLPPLPGIHSEDILLQVFTHRSFFARPTHVFEDHPDDPSPDNEKFEHLGDTVLGLTVTSLLLEMYPYLRVGPSTKTRALIVTNATLADISLRYKLPDRLRLHPAQAITLRASTNVQADVFESYVGGLYVDQGLEVIKAWLNPLLHPYAAAAYQIVRTQHGLPPLPTPLPTPASSPRLSLPTRNLQNSPRLVPLTTTIGHLALFNQQLQKGNKEVEWDYSDGAGQGTTTTPVWVVRVIVNGEFYGRGRGGTKKAARNEAAKEGLEKMGIYVW